MNRNSEKVSDSNSSFLLKSRPAPRIKSSPDKRFQIKGSSFFSQKNAFYFNRLKLNLNNSFNILNRYFQKFIK